MSQKKEYHSFFASTFLDLYLSEQGYLYADWKGYVNVNSVKEGCEAILNGLKETSCCYLLNDNRKVKGTWTQSIRWLETDFMPRMVDNGLQKIAYLYSSEKGARYSLNRLLEVNDQYEGQVFDALPKAISWLLDQPMLNSVEDDTEFFVLKTKNKYTKIYFENIYYISTHNRKSVIQTKVTQYSTRKSLNDLNDLLPSHMFFRIHKSHIINTLKVKHLKYHAGGYYHLYLQDFGKIYLTVSKTKIKDLKILLNW